MPLVEFSQFEMLPVESNKSCRRPDRPVAVNVNGSLLCVIPTEFDKGDGMSFPWFIRLTWDDPWHQRYIGPSLLHDYLLWLLATGQGVMKKREIDWLFEGALMSQGVSSLETWIFVNAVRIKRT